MSISYAPGSWILISGRGATVLLPGAEKSRAAAVWSVVDGGGGFAPALDAIVSGGLAGLPSFALIAGDGSSTRAVVRGDLELHLRTNDGLVTVSGSGTWTEETVVGVRGFALWPEHAGEQRLALETGLVRAAGVESGVVEESSPLAAAPVLALVPQAAPLIAADEYEDDYAEPEPEPDTETEPEPDEDEADVEPEAEHESELDTEADTDDFGSIPDMPTEAHDVGLIAAFGAPTAPPPSFPPPIEHAPEPVAHVAPEPQPEPVTLAFSSGDSVPVTRPVVVGRAPHPDRFTHFADPMVVRVPSPHQEISGTHVSITPGADPDEVTVTDLGSTNGTLLVRGGGTPEELRAGVSVSVARGTVIDLGDGLTIRVV